jgi:membrane protein
MSLLDWLKLPYDAARRLVMQDEGLELSGYIAFTAFLSLVPFLIFLTALTGFLSDEQTAADLIDAMFTFMPTDVAETLAPALGDVISARRGGLLTFGILTTLWFASNGIEALRVGLNRAYRVTEERPIWRLRLQSIGFVVVSGFVLFFLSLAVILGPLVWDALGPLMGSTLETELVFISSRSLVAAALLWGALLLLHRWLPDVRQPFGRVLPGVCVTVVLWLTGASLFSWYVGHLADYSVVYGSLGGVAITLVFFYLTAAIFIFGAELNAVWRRRAQPPEARPEPAHVDH